MKPETINGSLVAAHLAGHLNARIRMAADDGDLETAISHLKALIRAFTNLEFNQACNEWLRDWNKQLEQYEELRLKRTAR
jgi:hypothetical protein